MWSRRTGPGAGNSSVPALGHSGGAGQTQRHLGARPVLHELLAAPAKAGLQAAPRRQSNQVLRCADGPAPAGHQRRDGPKTPDHHHDRAFKRVKQALQQREFLRLAGELEKLSLAKEIILVKPPVYTWWNKNH